MKKNRFTIIGLSFEDGEVDSIKINCRGQIITLGNARDSKIKTFYLGNTHTAYIKALTININDNSWYENDEDSYLSVITGRVMDIEALDDGFFWAKLATDPYMYSLFFSEKIEGYEQIKVGKKVKIDAFRYVDFQEDYKIE